MGLRCVFDDFEIMRSGDLEKWRHVRSLAGEVDRQQRFRSRCHGRFDQLRIDVVSRGIAIDEDDVASHLAHRQGRGDVGVRGNDDLVASADL